HVHVSLIIVICSAIIAGRGVKCIGYGRTGSDSDPNEATSLRVVAQAGRNAHRASERERGVRIKIGNAESVRCITAAGAGASRLACNYFAMTNIEEMEQSFRVQRQREEKSKRRSKKYKRRKATGSNGNAGSRCHRGGGDRAEPNSEESDLMPCTHVRVVGERRTRETEWQQKKGTEWSLNWSVGRLAVLVCPTHALRAEISDALALATKVHGDSYPSYGKK
ncbi:hypothetical protein ALC60_01408, partial [Trachymyrmex zeteki]